MSKRRKTTSNEVNVMSDITEETEIVQDNAGETEVDNQEHSEENTEINTDSEIDAPVDEEKKEESMEEPTTNETPVVEETPEKSETEKPVVDETPSDKPEVDTPEQDVYARNSEEMAKELIKKYKVYFAYSYSMKSIAVLKEMMLVDICDIFIKNREAFIGLVYEKDLKYIQNIISKNIVPVRKVILKEKAKEQFLDKINFNSRYTIRKYESEFGSSK